MTLVVSLIAGTAASVLMSQKNTLSGNILLGFCGTLIGDVIDQSFNINRWGFVPEVSIATLCAIVLIWGWRTFVNKPRRRF
jgi:uncharacterized membrane protein YeaQ/YmgE (transglycosylase-associated protein family)